MDIGVQKYIRCLMRQIPTIKEKSKEKNIVVWGAGECGIFTKEILESNDICIYKFVDSNYNLYRPLLDGYIIMSPRSLSPKNDYVITAIKVTPFEIENTLYKLGFNESNSLIVVNEDGEISNVAGCTIGKCTTEGAVEFSKNGLCKSIGAFTNIHATAQCVPNHSMGYVSNSNSFINRPYVKKHIHIDEQRMDAIIESKEQDIKEKNWGVYKNYLALNRPVTVGNDVWIGANAIITEGVSIGDGTIVGAGAVVTHDVEPYAVVVGVPARVLKYRFSKEIREALLRIKWWNWPIQKINENYEKFFDIEKFVEEFDVKQD